MNITLLVLIVLILVVLWLSAGAIGHSCAGDKYDFANIHPASIKS